MGNKSINNTDKRRINGSAPAAVNGHDGPPLRTLAEQALKKYFSHLNGHAPGDLYGLVLGEIEPPLLKTVMDYTGGNQSRAAEILGINRATLRKKLITYQLIN